MSLAIEIVEVGPRDGLQAEPTILEPKVRAELIVLLMEAGARRIEVGSFVSPVVVPQMANAEEVIAALPDDDSVSLVGLVLNRRGLDRALASKVDEVNFVAPVTDGYSRANQRADAAAALDEVVAMIPEAQAARRRASVTVSVAFGCPYEGEVAPERVAAVARQIAEAGADEIALADTIGAAGPRQVEALIEDVRVVAGGMPLRVHFHNTRNTAYANVAAAVGAGVRSVDAAIGGYGGSPFSPGAGGNVATEDVAYLLSGMGVDHHLAVDRLLSITEWLQRQLGSPAPAMLGRAGMFP